MMPEANSSTSKSTEEEVHITRIFDAPRELVFNAWADPRQLEHWFAPRGCTIEINAFDFRPGGSFQTSLRTPESYTCLCGGRYLEIVAPERIVYTLFFSDRNGNLVEPADAGADKDWPRETIVRVTFEEIEKGTLLTLHQTVSESVARRTGAYPSWLDMLDRLDEQLTPAYHSSESLAQRQ